MTMDDNYIMAKAQELDAKETERLRKVNSHLSMAMTMYQQEAIIRGRQLRVALEFFKEFREFVHNGGNLTTLEMYKDVTEVEYKILKIGEDNEAAQDNQQDET